jgi:two-component system chemotaxis response regulator CheY
MEDKKMPKILVVDDAAFMRMNVKNILSGEGYEDIIEAENGEMAVKKYKEENPDLVTLDITMPEMDGIEALKKIKENDPDAKVIMCSAMGQQSMVIEAVEVGAEDFIVKPFDKGKIKEAVSKVLD